VARADARSLSDDQPEQRQRSSLAVWLAVVAVLLPLAYVLSPGPALLLVKNGYLNIQYFEWIFWPLAKLYENSPPVTAFYDAYFTLLGLRP